jgi:drug/metabolite transporter (DMT)-like permease
LRISPTVSGAASVAATRVSPTTTAVCTTAALLAFAGNSVLCRLALGQHAIDAATFSMVRVVSGAAVLGALARGRADGPRALAGSWGSAVALFAYAIPFSFAYLTLTTGTGALLLFGAVQVTMMAAAWISGERPSWMQWIGLALASGGLVYLVRPGVAAPSPAGAALMVTAGAAWGLYSIRGRGIGRPLDHTAGNFVRAVPFAGVVWLAFRGHWHANPSGAWLAVASGAITSGLGYAVWYTALRGLTATRAAIVQLAVPILAAACGVAFMGEVLTVRLAIAAAAVVTGVLFAIAGHQRRG